MTDLFLDLFNRSISASYLILAVLLARQLLKKAPKWVNVALWAIVGIRLLCPVSLESGLSLIPSARTVPETIAFSPAPAVDTGFAGLDQVINPALTQAAAPQVGASVNPMQIYLSVAAWIWVMGLAGMLLYTVISYFRLDLKMETAVRYWGNVYQSEVVASPFVLGLFRPRIYLPFTLDEKTMEHVIAHEQAHIRRKDHWWKPLGFLLVSIHWFNPLVWLSYVLLCQDIELACDEKVIRSLTYPQRADYSQALLVCSLHRRPISACPLSFGEVGVKDRVKSILHYRKPTVWILVVSVLVCGVLALCFLTDPKEEAVPTETQPQMEIQETTLPAETEQIYESGLLSAMAYSLELAFPDTGFHPMPKKQLNAILDECGSFLEGYELVARESITGIGSYILAFDAGVELTNSRETTQDVSDFIPLYSDTLSDGRFLYYPAPQTEEARREYEELTASMTISGAVPTILPQGYWISSFKITQISNDGYVLIEPPDNACNFSYIAGAYITTSQGRAYIADAAQRGVWLTQPQKPYLAVYRVDLVYGERTEYIALTEDLANTIQAESLDPLHRGYGFAATLSTQAGDTYYSEIDGVPRTVLDMAINRCNYTFATPEDIGPIAEARFDCPWLDGPLYADEKDLPRLEEILKNAELGYMGSCGYGAFLHLTLEDGSTLTLAKGTDECDSIAFGSWGGYFLGDSENTEFWNLFGLDEIDHLPLPN